MGDYDILKPIVKKRDGLVCQLRCGRGTLNVHFRVVRKEFWKEDSEENLHVVCRWCATEKELD